MISKNIALLAKWFKKNGEAEVDGALIGGGYLPPQKTAINKNQ